MTSLSEFLLARIAEDEAAVDKELRRVAGSPRRNGKTHALRMRAECEAKRQIVARCRPRYAVFYCESERLLADAFDQPTVQTVAHSGPIWPFAEAESVLRDLAAVYADHPDYDQAWRVD